MVHLYRRDFGSRHALVHYYVLESSVLRSLLLLGAKRRSLLIAVRSPAADMVLCSGGPGRFAPHFPFGAAFCSLLTIRSRRGHRTTNQGVGIHALSWWLVCVLLQPVWMQAADLYSSGLPLSG